jgi:hypothetical protein
MINAHCHIGNIRLKLPHNVDIFPSDSVAPSVNHVLLTAAMADYQDVIIVGRDQDNNIIWQTSSGESDSLMLLSIAKHEIVAGI